MRIRQVLLILLLLAGPHPRAMAGPPALTYVTQPVRHWETFFLLGEGFDAHDVKILRGTLHDARTPDELAAAIVAGGWRTLWNDS